MYSFKQIRNGPSSAAQEPLQGTVGGFGNEAAV